MAAVRRNLGWTFPAVQPGERVFVAMQEIETLPLVRAVYESAIKAGAFVQVQFTSDYLRRSLLNYGIPENEAVNRFTTDILIDEKIGDTIYIALGRAYPECGGTNLSVIHWDIVKDMRQEGAVYLDGKLIYENGQMLI